METHLPELELQRFDCEGQYQTSILHLVKDGLYRNNLTINTKPLSNGWQRTMVKWESASLSLPNRNLDTFCLSWQKRGFCRPLLAVQKMLRKCLQRLGLCYQWQGKSVRKIFNTQSSIFQVYVTGIILTSAVTCSPTFLFLKHIKVALDLNIYCMKIFPQLKELCCHSWWWSTELRLFLSWLKHHR